MSSFSHFPSKGFPSGSDEYRRESERHWEERAIRERLLRRGDLHYSEVVPLPTTIPIPDSHPTTTKDK
jgi:hypothetical protein